MSNVNGSNTKPWRLKSGLDVSNVNFVSLSVSAAAFQLQGNRNSGHHSVSDKTGENQAGRVLET